MSALRTTFMDHASPNSGDSRQYRSARPPRTSRDAEAAFAESESKVGALGLLIYQAAKHGSTESLKFALGREEAKEHINYQDRSTQMTPLMAAAMNGHLACVKLLLCHSADIHASIPRPRSRSQRQTAASLAAKHNHTNVAKYLQGCIDDLVWTTCTRAHMEGDVLSITDNPRCSYKEADQFCSLLRQLLTRCDYQLEGGEDDEPTLLIRAAEANNSLIVHRLVDEFGVNPLFSSHPETAQNVLHFACLNMSLLRFYFASRHNKLLCILDSRGNSPLHIACAKNDLEFVGWLFRGVLNTREGEGEGMDGENISQRCLTLPSRRSHILSTTHFMHSPTTSIAGHSPHGRLLGAPRKPRAFSALTRPPLQLMEDPAREGSPSSPTAPMTFNVDENGTTEDSDAHQNGMADGGYSTDQSVESPSCTVSLPDELDEVEDSSLEVSNCTSGSSYTLRMEGSGTSAGSSFSDAVPPEYEFLGPFTSAPISATFISDMRLFRKNVDGESILHLLACRGHAQLMNRVLRVAEILQHSLEPEDLDVLTQRDGFTLRTPIEEGLMVGHLDCVRLLIEFVAKTDQMKRLFVDEDLLKVAVLFDQQDSTKNLEALKMLIGFGFHSGLAKSITLADLKERCDVTRLLLYFQTQMVNALEYVTVHPNHSVSLKTGRIKWEGFNLRHMEGEWLHDAYDAVDSVSRAFNDPKRKVHENFRYSQTFFRNLGARCLHYFSNKVPIPSSPKQFYSCVVPIIEMNLSENHLTSVPPELFQQPHLRSLKLSHNELKELPTSDVVHETLYSCPKLRKLELDWNCLESLPEELCRGVGRTLEELNVVHNHLKKLPPGLWVMKKLKKLNLSQNKLSHLHVFSSAKYFFNTELTRRVVTSFEATPSGMLKIAEGGRMEWDQEALCKVEQYLIELISFLKTVLVIQEKDDPSINLAQAVIDIHWRRYRDYENYTQIPRSAETCCIADLNTEEEEEEEEESSLIKIGLSGLDELHLNNNLFQELPWDLPCIAPNLRKVYLMQNLITDLDVIHGPPSKISTLCLGHNRIATTMKLRSPNLPCASPLLLLSNQYDRANLYCSHCNRTQVERLSKLSLEHNHLTQFNLVNLANDCSIEDLPQNLETYANIELQQLFPALAVLNLARNHLEQVPSHMEKLTSLSSLDLSGNTAITELPEELGKMNPQVFITLQLDELFIKNIPHSILETKSARNIICYLKAIREKSQAYRRIKLMVVGAANKGKTSLLLNLTKQGRIQRFVEVALDRHQQPLATNGVELGDWEYAPRGKKKVTFMTWDFGGQEEYYATHQCFLTARSLFLLVWNVTDGEAGLLSLQPWLENIEARARDSPVIVVATHADGLAQNPRNQAAYRDKIAALQAKFSQLYIQSADSFAYPRIKEEMQVVSCRDSRHMEQLRSFIYNTAVQYFPPPPNGFRRCTGQTLMQPLLEQKIPESYVKLQDIVRLLAHACSQQNRVPIFTRREYLSKVREFGEISVSNDELDQATSFLHSNGILLHFEDSQLSDLYFLNPQWLCSMLANVITIRERNPHVKNGIISIANLRQILHGTTSSLAIESEIISLMRKFEVMLQLDDKRLLIPSLLPDEETHPHIIMPQSALQNDSDGCQSFTALREQPPAPILCLPDLLVRYFLLPYIPNGFFPRVIARILSSDIADQVRASFSTGPLESYHVLNNAHWECWRSGMSLIWNQMEIMRIAPLRFPLPQSRGATIISSLKQNQEKESLMGVEIVVAVLPEDQIQKCPVLPSQHQCDETCRKNRCMATWLLHMATDIADSVFEDWYEVFAQRRGLHYALSWMASPCPKCFKFCQGRSSQREEAQETTSSVHRFRLGSLLKWTSEPSSESETLRKPLYVFSSQFCCLRLTQDRKVTCPAHGEMDIAEVAPDLVFADFAPCALFPEKTVKTIKKMGEGGFGTVSLAHLNTGSGLVKVAVKELQAAHAAMNCRTPGLEDEARCWQIYQDTSVEARMMYQLDHPNILTLLGVTFNPMRLVLELAPRGDLRSAIRHYHRKNRRLNRRTLKATLTQIADAMAYLHSKKILFRDLKPGNVLVWQFPQPSEQWNPDASVLLKLADYGISKQISPQGIHSKEGTPQYLPPEVILHSEREAASLKVDVYSFGMLMYYLFAFKNPFGSALLVGSLLRNGRRPELPVKLWPHSIQMVELMCWCWSDNPNQRPTFEQILSILHGDASSSLVGGMLVSREDEIHAACIKTVTIPTRRRSSVVFSPTLSSNSSSSTCCQRMAHIIPSTTSGIGMETGLEVWFATVTGSLSVTRYHSTGTCIEQIQHPSNSYISSIVVAGGNIWVGSVGCGLWVYDPASRQPVAVWGETERRKVFQLISLENSVLALTHSGMYLFPALLSDSSSTVQVLVPSHHCPRSGLDNNVGVYIPQSGNLPAAEAWVCAQTGHWFKILSPTDISTKEEVEARPSQGRKIRHMQPVVVQDKCYLFVADRHIIQKWEVVSRSCLDDFDCHAACWPNTSGVGSSVPLKQGRVTSLTSGNSMLYVGTGGGTILVVNAHTLETTSRLSAYTTPVRCLFSVKMTQAFSRMISTVDSTTMRSNSSSTGIVNTSVSTMRSSSSSTCVVNSVLSTAPSMSSVSSLDSVMTSLDPESAAVSDERSVLMSFGIGYKGVVGSHRNHPDSFLLPHALTSCPCCTHFFIKAQPSPTAAYLLLWSVEGGAMRGADGLQLPPYEDVDGGEEHLDGSSE